MKKPGVALKAWRDARHLSQDAAAQLLDPPVTQGAWAAWENGKKPPSLGNALGIERLTGGVIRAAEWVPDRKRPDESGPDVNDVHAKAG